MIRRLSLPTLLFAMAPLAQAAMVDPVNLLENGSFEQLAAGASLTGSQWSVYTSLPGWQVDTVEVQQGTVIAPYDGLRYVELDTHGRNSNASISQSFPTVVGQEYRFRFAYVPRPEVSAASNAIAVSWGDTSAPASVLLDGLSPSNLGVDQARWRLFEFAFVAASESSFVRFAAAGRADTLGGFIDGVSVTAFNLEPNGTPEVPVPAAVWLFASALIGVSRFSRHSRTGALRA